MAMSNASKTVTVVNITYIFHIRSGIEQWRTINNLKDSFFREATLHDTIYIIWGVDEGYIMPRKDKYEGNSGNRRTHTYMSAEDQASGKKSYWTELEITGTIRNLSPNLFQLTHLTALYIKNNQLSRLPVDICNLVNLRHLDLSNNKLRSLPAELGELIHLRELNLANNCLRILPYELGKLFNLMILTLNGNPLNKDILTIYSEPNGTSKLLTFMLDNLQGRIFHYQSV
ncbi:hypothetical protein JTB14_001272 [Gonioctena quinquepunctata]|nr:hypothetical protein JTB14_001272 [Gonioctena quinquepunctata]